MGITIHHILAQEKQWVKKNLDEVEQYAERIKKELTLFNIPVETIRESDNCLFVNVGNCETLSFNFKSWIDWEKENKDKGYSYELETIKDFKPFDTVGEHYQKYPEQTILWSSSFCKTQFSRNILEHKAVADIIKLLASKCRLSNIYDEGDYYYSGDIENAVNSIKKNGIVINGIVEQLTNLGWDNDKIIKGGETTLQ